MDDLGRTIAAVLQVASFVVLLMVLTRRYPRILVPCVERIGRDTRRAVLAAFGWYATFMWIGGLAVVWPDDHPYHRRGLIVAFVVMTAACAAFSAITTRHWWRASAPAPRTASATLE